MLNEQFDGARGMEYLIDEINQHRKALTKNEQNFIENMWSIGDVGKISDRQWAWLLSIYNTLEKRFHNVPWIVQDFSDLQRAYEHYDKYLKSPTREVKETEMDKEYKKVLKKVTLGSEVEIDLYSMEEILKTGKVEFDEDGELALKNGGGYNMCPEVFAYLGYIVDGVIVGNEGFYLRDLGTESGFIPMWAIRKGKAFDCAMDNAIPSKTYIVPGIDYKIEFDDGLDVSIGCRRVECYEMYKFALHVISLHGFDITELRKKGEAKKKRGKK